MQIPKKKTLFSWQLLNAINECLWQYIEIIFLEEKFDRSRLTERGEKMNLASISYCFMAIFVEKWWKSI